jgi:hypothetical protein
MSEVVVQTDRLRNLVAQEFLLGVDDEYLDPVIQAARAGRRQSFEQITTPPKYGNQADYPGNNAPSSRRGGLRTFNSCRATQDRITAPLLMRAEIQSPPGRCHSTVTLPQYAPAFRKTQSRRVKRHASQPRR